MRRNEPIENRLLLSRRNSRRNFAADEPIEDRLSLSRRNSWRNFVPYRRNDDGRDNKGRNSENRRNDGHDKKEQELKELPEQVRILKRNEPLPHQVLGHFSQTEPSNPDSNTPKNAEGTQRKKGQETDVKNMEEYLTEVMATINAFSKQLKEQSATNPIHSDK